MSKVKNEQVSDEKIIDSLVCPNCGTVTDLNYCPECSQKCQINFSIKSILHDFIEVLWGADSRVIRTLQDYFNPGVYLRNWLDKKQARYISPVKMFLVINLIYFFTLSLLFSFNINFDTFVSGYESQINEQFYSDDIRSSSERIIAENGFEKAEFEKLYNDSVFTTSNTLIIVFSMIIALCLYLVNFRKTILFYHYLNSGLYYGGFILILLLTFNITLALTARIIETESISLDWLNQDSFLSILFMAVVFLFACFTQKRLYKEKTSISVLKSIVIAFLITFIGLILYRFILFWITLYFVILSN